MEDEDEPLTDDEYVEVIKGAIDDIALLAPIHDPVKLQNFLGWINELIVSRAFTMAAEDAEPDA